MRRNVGAGAERPTAPPRATAGSRRFVQIRGRLRTLLRVAARPREWQHGRMAIDAPRSPSLGLGLPQFGAAEPLAPAALDGVLEVAEQQGFDAVWVGEGLLSRSPSLEPLTTLAYAAARTARVRLGMATLVLPFYQPVLLAKAVATLDWLSGGRAILGVSLGVGDAPHAAFGNRRDERRARFAEYVEIVRRLLAGEAVDHDGSFRSLRGVSVQPAPVQRPLPIWIGGGVPAALARAARLGDGWLGSGTASTDAFAEQVARVRAELDALGRPRASFAIGKRAFLAIDQDPDDVVRWFALTYGQQLADFARTAADPSRWVLAGSVEQVVEQLLALRAAGADTLILHPVGQRLEAQTQLLAEHALPALRAS